jgi:hypothetical protein
VDAGNVCVHPSAVPGGHLVPQRELIGIVSTVCEVENGLIDDFRGVPVYVVPAVLSQDNEL